MEKKENGYDPCYMSALLDSRNNPSAGSDSFIWTNWHTSLSLIAKGKPRSGNSVIVVSHKPHYFSSPDNIRSAINGGLVNGAGVYPDAEFKKLIEEEQDGLVYVIDASKLEGYTSGQELMISDGSAFKHPLTVPIAGSEDRASTYLDKSKEIYGDDFKIWWQFNDHDKPLARLLYLGDDFSDFDGSCNLNYYGHFVGVKKESEASQKNFPTVNDIFNSISDYIASSNTDLVRQELKKQLE